MIRGLGSKIRTILANLSDRQFAAIGIGFMVLAVFGLAVPRMGSHFLGAEYVDHYGTQWFYWFMEHQISTWQSPVHSNLFFYPWGKDIFGHTGANVLDALLAVPFRVVFGHVWGYNLFLLAGLSVSAWAFTRLAREFTDSKLAIGLGMALFTFSPFILIEAREGRPTQALLALPVFFLLYVWRSGISRGYKAPILAGVFLALCGYQYWYYAFFGGLVCAAHGCWRFYDPAADSGGRWRTLARHSLIAVVGLTLTLPVALPLFSGQGMEDETVPGLLATDDWSLHESLPVTAEGTLVALHMWQPATRYSGSYVWDPDGSERFLRRTHLVPWLLWLSVLAWLIKPGRLHRGPVLAMVLTSMVLATGPLLIAGEIALPNVVYIYMSKALPFLRRLWWPERAYVFVGILFGLTAVVNLDHLRRYGRNWQRVASVAIVLWWTGALMQNKHAPFWSWDATVPAGYRCLVDGPEGAIIELPYAWTQAHLYFQTLHHRPIMGGMIENNPVFTPEESVVFREENTYVSELISLSDMNNRAPYWDPADKDEVYELGYRYIVLQKDAFGVAPEDRSLKDNIYKKRLRHMRGRIKNMAGNPVYDDARVTIFAPWGDPCPCDLETFQTDSEATGGTGLSAAELLVEQDKNLTLYRIIKGTAGSGDDDSADDDSVETEALPGGGQQAPARGGFNP